VKIILFSILAVAMIGLMIPNVLASQNHGLVEGQWAKYKIIGPEAESSEKFIELMLEKGTDGIMNSKSPFPNYNWGEIDWIKIEVIEIKDNNSFTVKHSFQSYDGSQTSNTREVFSLNDNPFFIQIKPSVNNKVKVLEFASGDDLRLTGSEFIDVGPMNINTHHYSVTEITGEIVPDSLTKAYQDAYFDKETGMMAYSEFGFEIGGLMPNQQLYSAKIWVAIDAIDFHVPNPEPTCGEGTVLKDNECVIEEEKGGGCLIATAAYGSEMAPQVQFLRELRDNTILQTQSGTTFMTGFNQFYYSFSPAVADYERDNPMFKEAVKLSLTPLLTSLAILNYVDIDTEQEMLGYGIGVILLNIGMYFVAPAIVIISLKKRFKF
jgi:hypothetical protein